MSASKEDVMQLAIDPSILLRIVLQKQLPFLSFKIKEVAKKTFDADAQVINKVSSRLSKGDKRVFILEYDLNLSIVPHVLDDMSIKQLFFQGVICQHESSLVVLYSSFNKNIERLTSVQIRWLEAYLAIYLTKIYGKQTIVFYDLKNERPQKNLFAFLSDEFHLEDLSVREYSTLDLAHMVFSAASESKMGLFESYIKKNIKPISKKYSYPNESKINPAYQDIASVTRPLSLGEKRIWVLRSDFILALGVKNAYEKEYGYRGFMECFCPKMYSFLDLNDRYGHPSLTLSEGTYDGGVYYAGYICQRELFLQVYLVSGRFERFDLNPQQLSILETYIALQFRAIFGLQDIVFDYGHSEDPRYHAAFFNGGDKQSGSINGNPRRCYDESLIKSILDSLVSKESIMNDTARFFDSKVNLSSAIINMSMNKPI